MNLWKSVCRRCSGLKLWHAACVHLACKAQLEENRAVTLDASVAFEKTVYRCLGPWPLSEHLIFRKGTGERACLPLNHL